MKDEIFLLLILFILSLFTVSIGISVFLVFDNLDLFTFIACCSFISIGLLCVIFSVNQIKKEL